MERPSTPNDDNDQLFTDALEEHSTLHLSSLTKSNQSYTSTSQDAGTKSPPRNHREDEDARVKTRFMEQKKGKTRMGDADEPTANSGPGTEIASSKSSQDTIEDVLMSSEEEAPYPLITSIQDPQQRIDPEHFHLYNLALSNLWSIRELHHRIAPKPPIFVYCSLMLPWVLATLLDRPVQDTIAKMTPALLTGFKRVTIKFANLPTLVPNTRIMSSDTPLQGFLIGSVQAPELEKIEDYINLADHTQDVVEVEVQVKHGQRQIVGAYVYTWTGALKALEDKGWDPVGYLEKGFTKESSPVQSSTPASSMSASKKQRSIEDSLQEAMEESTILSSRAFLPPREVVGLRVGSRKKL